jgi:hypothetical protein
VIANTIPKATELELANFGIESRTITATDLLAALESFILDRPIEKGRKLAPDDECRGMPQFANSGDKIWQTVAVARHIVDRVLQRDIGSAPDAQFRNH